MRGPFYIAVAAVRDYLWLRGRPDCTDGEAFDRAERELIEIAIEAYLRESVDLGGGRRRYRLGRDRGRMQLIVGPGEGDRPALIAVRPGHDDGRGVAPHRL